MKHSIAWTLCAAAAAAAACQHTAASARRAPAVDHAAVVSAAAAAAAAAPRTAADPPAGPSASARDAEASRAVAPRAPEPAVPDADREALARGENAFAAALYARVANTNDDVVVSPASLALALGMTYGGARGETAAQLARVMHFDLPPERLHAAFAGQLADLAEVGRQPGYAVRVANRLWGARGLPFVPSFLELARDRYGAAPEALDFARDPEAARQTINAWVDGQTEHRIPELLEPGLVQDATQLVLTNAVYFLGHWAHAFAPAQTRDEPFHAAGGRQVRARMMHQRQDFGLARLPGVAVLELPYAADRVVMDVVLPDARDGLPELERQFASGRLDAWIGALAPRHVEVALPRFASRASLRLGSTLAGMGAPRAFGTDADFSGLVRGPVRISEVVHQAYVRVDEAGTQAAAATAVVMAPPSVPATPPGVESFRADHPFLYLLRDARSGAVLFVGRVLAPLDA